MNKLITHVPAGEVSADFQAAAAVWPLWDSATHPQKPKKSGKFIFDYSEHPGSKCASVFGRSPRWLVPPPPHTP